MTNNFITASGDLFFIPKAQYAVEVREYFDAYLIEDEGTMLHFESGATGWVEVVDDE